MDFGTWRAFRRWRRKTAPIYLTFVPDTEHSWSEAWEMFCYESEGARESMSEGNRYLLGKRNMDLTLEMWNEDIPKGLLMKIELLEDLLFHPIDRWLRKTLSRICV